MAAITITIPDAQVTRVRDAFATAYNYQAAINGAPNPESRLQFLQRKLREHILDVVRSQESQAAGEVARKAQADKVDSEITLS